MIAINSYGIFKNRNLKANTNEPIDRDSRFPYREEDGAFSSFNAYHGYLYLSGGTHSHPLWIDLLYWRRFLLNFIVRVIINPPPPPPSPYLSRLLPIALSYPFALLPYLLARRSFSSAVPGGPTDQYDTVSADTGAAAPDNKARTRTCPISLHLNSAPNT